HGREGVVRAVQWSSGSVGVDDRDVLDSHAEAAGEIDARFERKGHARLERLAIPAHQVWMLMAIEADPMTGPMNEELTVAGFIDHAPGRGVDRLRGRVLSRGGVAGLLCASHDVVDRLLLAPRARTDMDGARDVGPIATHRTP